MVIYKICSEIDWQRACKAGVYLGSDDDKRDGFIHFSTKDQITGTLSKHFSGQEGLILLAVDAADFKPSELKFEVSRNGQKFPHLYGKLFPSTVKARYIICLNDAGEHEVEF